MYKEYFGLKELPFSIVPDPRYLYMSEKHREALAHLIYGIKSDGAFVLLTGEVGTGKTTVCRCMLEKLPPDTDVAFILNPKMTVEELLAAFCDELHIRYPENNTSIKVFVDRINAYLLDSHAQGRKTVLIVEEAQNLTMDVLEQLRLLTNLETNQHKLLRIVLVGQPELQDKLGRQEMRQLAQRITARYHLGPLSKKELTEYVTHRLAVAGVQTKLFPSPPMDALFRLSGGVPRLINVICDRALLGAYVQAEDRVSKATLARAAREVFGECDGRRPRKKALGWALAAFLLVAAAALTATLYHRNLSAVPAKSAALIRQVAAPAPEPEKLDTLEWPADQPMDQSKDLAFETLFGVWGIPYQAQGHTSPCRQARPRGLGCLEARSSLSSLLVLNRPAVLKLFDNQGREFYATIMSSDEKTALLAVGAGMKKIALKEIGRHWLGDYLLLWRMPKEYTTEIRPGEKGPEVYWIEQRLALAEGREAPGEKRPVFDGELTKQVKQFQLVRGLTPDGVVGPQTIILMNNAIGTNEPSLTGKKGG
ncbi:MAG: AAA family ATPase [Nitrospirae bacterium]|nr:AAA family ATPase [Nitrospirota bacterium]